MNIITLDRKKRKTEQQNEILKKYNRKTNKIFFEGGKNFEILS